MTSTSGQLLASPSWGLSRSRGLRRLGLAQVAVRFAAGGSRASDAAGAVGVLGATFALWTAFLAAVW